MTALNFIEKEVLTSTKMNTLAGQAANGDAAYNGSIAGPLTVLVPGQNGYSLGAGQSLTNAIGPVGAAATLSCYLQSKGLNSTVALQPNGLTTFRVQNLTSSAAGLVVSPNGNSSLIAVEGVTNGDLYLQPAGTGSIRINGPVNCGIAGGADGLTVFLDVRKDVNGPVISRVWNAGAYGAGTTASARRDWIVATSGGYVISQLWDNNGAPFFQTSAGTAVTEAQYDFASIRLRDSGGITKIQTNATGIGFFAAAPVARPAGATQAAITDGTGGTASGSNALSVISAGAAYSQTDMTNIKNGIATLAAAHNALRTALVNLGLIKGAA